MQEDQCGFLFVSCNQSDGRAGRKQQILANRHVQLNYRANNAGSRIIREWPAGPSRMMKLKFARRKKKDWGRTEEQPTHATWLIPCQDLGRLTLCKPDDTWLWGPQNLASEPEKVHENRALYFYSHKVASDLAGEVECAFWQVYVLQRHHQEPAIRQAIIALSSAYWEKKTFPKVAAHQLPMASDQEACKAIVELRSYMLQTAVPSHGVVLSCALLLHALEKLRGDVEAATFHLDNAISIFQTWTQCNQSVVSSEIDILQATLTRLDGNATIQDMYRLPKMKPPPIEQPWKPTFESTEQMQDWLTLHICQPFLALASRAMNGQDSNDDTAAQMKDLNAALSQWRLAAEVFTSAKACSPKDRLAVLSNESHYLTCKCALAEAMGNPASWNECLEDVLQVAREAVEIQQKLTKSSDTARRWSLNIGITHPLLRFVQNATAEPIRSDILKEIKKYEAFQESLPMCRSLWRSDGVVEE